MIDLDREIKDFVEKYDKNEQIEGSLIMKQIAAGLLAFALLGGCDSGSNPFKESETAGADGGGADNGDAGGGDANGGGDEAGGSEAINTAVTVPANLAGQVRNAIFDPDAETLTIEGVNLDEVPFTAEYKRKSSLDRGNYLAFTVQEDPLDRHFTAYAAQSNNSGAVRAVVAGSPGPRNRSFFGATFERDGNFDKPEVTSSSGLVSYAGNYVGVTNIGDVNGSDLKEITGPDVPDELVIPQALTVSGEAFVNADFADNRVEGNIVRRKIVEIGQELPSLVLVVTDIAGNGTFEGGVEYETGDPRSNTTDFVGIGGYGGVFGGPDSDGLAGVINLEEFDGVSNPVGFENELERGIFVLDQCGSAVSSPVCANVNPDAGSP
ncbi:hypothetical protein [Roseovarius sp. TE539]|uniref:hypothetical protein n=1 Tax=Roseovarius sp. TE539 TaxID=2249812 RepID=UPI0011BF045B|nr:hypothetical protein [Roseovarius sp. TE539]